MSVMTDGLYTLLTTDQTANSFYDDLSGRIYAMQAPQDDTLPLCVFNILDDAPFRYGGTTNDIEATVQIDLWGSIGGGYDAISDINDKLFTVLDGQAVTITGFTGGQAFNLDRGAPTTEEDAIRILSRWRIWASA
jgi:hypothetical protein